MTYFTRAGIFQVSIHFLVNQSEMNDASKGLFRGSLSLVCNCDVVKFPIFFSFRPAPSLIGQRVNRLLSSKNSLKTVWLASLYEQ